LKMWHRRLKRLPEEPPTDGGDRRRNRHDDWRGGRGRAARTRSGGGLRSPEIQDAEPICSAPMSEAATSSRGGLELLADDLVDPATVARHLDAVRQ
jgi:hypothetical protein